MTGLSGSGKSSLAFDTLYAEGQRRYVQSLSAYARQFLGQMEKPDVDSIEGLSPAISIDQKTTNNNPRSTVGTVTEINDYLRLLFARIGRPEIKNSNVIVLSSIDQMIKRILNFRSGARLQIIAPIIEDKKGTHERVLKRAPKLGYIRARIDGKNVYLDEQNNFNLDREKKHTIEIIVDRIILKSGVRSRLFSSVENALKITKGHVVVEELNGKREEYSDHYPGLLKNFQVGHLEPRLFSFNAPLGACKLCQGLGVLRKVDPNLVVPNKNLSLHQGAVIPWRGISSKYYPIMLSQFAKQNNINQDIPWKNLPLRQRKLILNGNKRKKFHFYYKNEFGGIRDVSIPFEGVLNNIERRFKNSASEFTRKIMNQYISSFQCPACHGYRLKPAPLSVKINHKNIGQVNEISVRDEFKFFKNLNLGKNDQEIAEPIVKEISSRLSFLISVGLGYLTLSRSAGTLSGGESQRIRLATQIGSNLSGVLYVLDEPSIGLHRRDIDKLLNSLKKMRDLGNTLVIVEHDEHTMRIADYIIDFGPGAGDNGGQVVAAGTPEEIEKNKQSITGQYLSGRKYIPVPKKRRRGNGHSIKLIGASEHNLKKIDVNFPLGKFITITGVSGSGKSTLINSILKRALKQKLNNNSEKAGTYSKIQGYKNIEKVIDIDQSPIGRTPRSNPATYTGVFDDIRNLFAKTNQAKIRGYTKGRFSFNVKGGRCENCHGDGIIKIKMNFLPDVYVTCEVCHGTRYNSETLEVTYKGKNISDVLNMTVDEAIKFFSHIPKIFRKLKTIQDVGLGYIQLGQSATTLSGGEAQRMKLASELHRLQSGKNFYILDEPTIGLHIDDIKHLLRVLHRLVDTGNTVLVIEHDLNVIKTADWVIDLGPEGGAAGGKVIATGTPEKIAKTKGSYTGEYLKPLLLRNYVKEEY